MDIFIKEITYNTDIEILNKFQHKKISDDNKYYEHCFAYYTLDNILNNKYYIQERTVEFLNSKPHLKNKQKCFSLSHSKGILALAFSDSECGIDIEKIQSRNFRSIAERMKLKNCNTLKDFYKAWTKYEAEYKLGFLPKSLQTFEYKDYIITACSANEQEEFDIKFQI